MIIEDEKLIKKIINPIKNFNNLARHIELNRDYSYVIKGKMYVINKDQLSPVVIIDDNNIFEEVTEIFKIEHQRLEDFLSEYKNNVNKITIEKGIFRLDTEIPDTYYETTITKEDIKQSKKDLELYINLKKEISDLEVKEFIFENKEALNKYIEENPTKIYFDENTNLVSLEPTKNYIEFRILKKYLAKTIKSSKESLFKLYYIDENTLYVEYNVVNTKMNSQQYFKILKI